MKRFRVVVNGTPYEVDVEELTGAAVPQTAPQVPAPAAAPKLEATPAVMPAAAPAAPSPTPASGGPGVVPAPMPGVILSIKVQPGQEVARGEVLLTLEAMKMENEILAPKAGRVKHIYVQTGQSVNPQDALVELE